MLDVKINSISLRGESHSGHLLENIQFILKGNSIFTIIGANGAGKTTLIKSFTNLLDDRFYGIEGEVFFHGKNLMAMDNESMLKIRQTKIRYVFQDAINSFDPLKTFEYYFNKVKENETAVNEILNYFLLPDLKTISKFYPYEVSGGMAQRINLALALLAEPQLLILDEPTSSIDIPIANIAARKIKEFANGNSSSVLIITQDLNFAFEVSDKIGYMREGSLTGFHPVTDFNYNRDNFDFISFQNRIDELEV